MVRVVTREVLLPTLTLLAAHGSWLERAVVVAPVPEPIAGAWREEPEPPVAYDTNYIWMCPGNHDKSPLDAIVKHRTARLRACYVHALPTKPHLEGTLTLRFVVDPEGWVHDARVAVDTLHAPAVNGCVLDALKLARVAEGPVRGHEYVVRYPIHFGPPGGGGSSSAGSGAR